MRTLYQRVIVAIVSTMVLATAGALGGYVLGHAYALRQAELRLDQYANRILLATIASTSESRAMLDTMNASPYALCSDAEIEYFRQLIFQSQYLKAAGRMRDDIGAKSDCRHAVLSRDGERGRHSYLQEPAAVPR